jgi:GT2 family glycosyltransferase/glycosyltransferase involved in cell wall biosynthesis
VEQTEGAGLVVKDIRSMATDDESAETVTPPVKPSLTLAKVRPPNSSGGSGLVKAGSRAKAEGDVDEITGRFDEITGRFDAIVGGVAEGWAYDKLDPSRSLTVEVFDGERLLGEATASIFRADLLKGGIGDGSHAYRYLLPVELYDGQSHLISARVKGAPSPLPGSPHTLRAAPLPTAEVEGCFDAIAGRLAEGWAYDKLDPSRSLTVEVFDGERLLGEATASIFRADLLENGVGDGSHAYRYLLPLELYDGQSHSISVRVKGARSPLRGSPHTLRAAPLPTAEAFPLRPEVVMAVPPLSDVQFTMLRALQSISETLLVHSRALAHLLEQTSRASGTGAAPNSELVRVRTPEELHGPLLRLVRDFPKGRHDWIFFSIIDWNFRFQRPQHLAKGLAALGNRVFYLSVKFEEDDPARQFVIKSQPTEGVFEIALCCTAPAPSIYAGIDDGRQLGEITGALLHMATTLGLERPVGIVEFPSWYPVAVALPGMLLVHDCLDHVAGFNNVAPRVVELENKLIEEADTVIVTSEYLNSIVTERRPAAIVRNGGEVAYFSTRPASTFEPAARPVVGYYGAISDWFDIDLVVFCANRHPEWHFVLIGATDGCDIQAAQRLPNVEFLGEKPYAELTHFLYAFDTCIIPFKLVELIQATNPVKIYEFLSAGKPVVVTDMPELRLLPPNLIYIAKTHEDFERMIAKSLQERAPELAEQRRAWAGRQSWAVRVRRLSTVVERQFPSVSVVVLCYNNLKFTQACLSSLLEFSDYPNLEILCVDNASTDGTGAYLQDMAQRHDAVRYIRNDSNIGFAAGNNVGMKQASGSIIILLNNDTYVTKGWVCDLIRPLLRHDDIGMTGPLTNMIGNEQKIAISYANMEEMAKVSTNFTQRRRRQTYPVQALAFFCVAIKRSVIKEVGYLDEGYGAGFFEDDDYCHRVRQAGYRLQVCDDVFIHHHLSASFDKLAGGEKAQLMRRNREIFEAKWGPWASHTYRNEAGFGE